MGPPVKFKVQNDQFYGVTAATVASLGTGYAVGDTITLAGYAQGTAPIGAPVQLMVTSIGGLGQVTGVSVISQLPSESTPIGGSYFAIQSNPIAVGSTTGSGTGATFNITQNTTTTPQSIILCNQEFATLTYCQDILDPNQMSDDFQESYANILGANLAISLTGDKKLANEAIQRANSNIMLARTSDGNENFFINDMTPDWIRIRGVDFPQNYSGPELGYDWGSLWPSFG
jgi:hypothetical protein